MIFAYYFLEHLEHSHEFVFLNETCFVLTMPLSKSSRNLLWLFAECQRRRQCQRRGNLHQVFVTIGYNYIIVSSQIANSHECLVLTVFAAG